VTAAVLARELQVSERTIYVRCTNMGTLEEMSAMMSFIIATGIQSQVGAVLPMADAREAIGAIIAGYTRGKTVFTG
jgi:D-arabinose 1-dehydrogenase-like Zn-dependent alcohol dehydrogenase